ncbi:hypothetical protein [Rufibacter sp. LB8]|uniref:hypothetical protein n=1 Tax=Rufibacter sp. LB8 TaxID=2777781 RepID=UPI00178C3B40|nr:hypothetical protein [Rufibacter sp. LB8]
MLIVYTLAMFALIAFLALAPRKKLTVPPKDDSDDDGGEPLSDGLPDLDLPPGISLPINDWEPDYNRPKIKNLPAF